MIALEEEVMSVQATKVDKLMVSLETSHPFAVVQ